MRVMTAPCLLKGMIVGLLIAGPGVVRSEVCLSRAAKAAAVIVHNGHTDQAAALREYVARITGAELPLVGELTEAQGKPAIVLETVAKVPGSSPRPEIAMQAYRITTKDQVLRLTGGSELGLTYAVWGLLEDHLGCRFYVSKGFEVVPAKPTLTIDKIDDFQQPAFAQRGFVWWPGYAWALKNRGAGYPADNTCWDLRASHSLHQLLPPAQLFGEHPEFYPLNNDGKRWQGAMGICGTNPDLPAYLAAALQAETEKRIKAQGDNYNPMFPIAAGQGDGFSGCQCDACRKLVHEEESEAAPYILALNRALDILAKTHPKQQVITFAYFGTLATPKTIKPHKNLWINVVSSDYSGQAAGDTVGPIKGNTANRDYAKALRDWPKVAPNRVTVWHWIGRETQGMGSSEWPAIFYLKGMVKFWQECGLYGASPQMCGGSWDPLYRWLFLKLAWNPDADVDALIHQFLEDNYGKSAAPYVWEYLKLAQAGYADSIGVPNTCRWTSFTPTMRLLMYPPSLLKKMTDLMDKAEAAAAKEKNPVLLANLIVAGSNAVDPLNIDAAKSSGVWGPANNKADGKRWFVAGADSAIPPIMMRVKQSILAGGGGYGYGQSFSSYGANNGGPLVKLESDTLSVDVCPDMKGQITSAVDKRSGKELLAVEATETGYRDIATSHWQMWMPGAELAPQSGLGWMDMWSKFVNPSRTRLETELMLSPGLHGINTHNRLRRSVVLDGAALRIERTYVESKGGNMPNPTRFTARWLLALPNPAKANIAVVGGGIKTMLDLRYAVPGGISGAKAGKRVSVGEAVDPFIVDNITYAEAVSDFQVTTLAVDEKAQDTIKLQLDRGDGVAVVLTTPAAGWEKIELQPMMEKKHLRITLVGVREARGPAPVTHALPSQTLTAKEVPVSTVEPIILEEQLVTAKIKELGDGRAINELDGAELIWIPAGEFLRGSPEGKGASNERPQKEIFLDGYWIYKYPVTLTQYTNFCSATGTKFRPHWGQGMHAQPVGEDGDYPVLVNWFAAEVYSKWVGAALPTEAQWEKAARGTDGREYPWGDEWDPEKAVGRERTIDRFSAGLMPVGSLPTGASPYGVEDMAGNCWEWVADWYAHEYYAIAPARNPTGPEMGTHKVLRGGYALFDERLSRSAARMVHPPHVGNWTLTGFRCVIDAPGPAKSKQ